MDYKAPIHYSAASNPAIYSDDVAPSLATFRRTAGKPPLLKAKLHTAARVVLFLGWLTIVAGLIVGIVILAGANTATRIDLRTGWEVDGTTDAVWLGFIVMVSSVLTGIVVRFAGLCGLVLAGFEEIRS